VFRCLPGAGGRTRTELSLQRILSSIESWPPASKPKGIVECAVRVCTLHPYLAKPVAVKLAVETSGCVDLVGMRNAWFTGKAITPSLLDRLRPVARGVERAADNTPAQLDILLAVAALLVVNGNPISVRIRVQIRTCSATLSAIFASSAENKKIVITFAHFLNSQTIEQARAGIVVGSRVGELFLATFSTNDWASRSQSSSRSNHSIPYVTHCLFDILGKPPLSGFI